MFCEKVFVFIFVFEIYIDPIPTTIISPILLHIEK